MGLFDLFFGGFGSRRNNGMSDEYRNALREIRKQKSKLYRGVRTAVIIATALSVTLFLLALFVSDLRKKGVFEFVFVIFALCAGGGMMLPWITQYDRDKRKAQKGEAVPAWHKIMVFAFWGLIGVCVVLWIISVFVVGDGILTFVQAVSGEDKSPLDPTLLKAYTMLRVSIIVTLQVAVGSVIGASTMRYGNKYLMLRVVMYVAALYLDIWLSWFVGGVTINGLTSRTFPPISNTFLWVLAVMMLVALIAAGAIFGSQARRKEIELFMKGDMEALTDGDVDLIDAQANRKTAEPAPSPQQSAPVEKDPEQQLAKIKDLLDKGIITEEEYAAKRKDIIDKM
ncbi:MAG: SHOCT domain-containing protein [Clostridiales bacterium]|nr:SHOCT domain-containing protein [Clostridiales bacterium]